MAVVADSSRIQVIFFHPCSYLFADRIDLLLVSQRNRINILDLRNEVFYVLNRIACYMNGECLYQIRICIRYHGQNHICILNGMEDDAPACRQACFSVLPFVLIIAQSFRGDALIQRFSVCVACRPV